MKFTENYVWNDTHNINNFVSYIRVRGQMVQMVLFIHRILFYVYFVGAFHSQQRQHLQILLYKYLKISPWFNALAIPFILFSSILSHKSEYIESRMQARTDKIENKSQREKSFCL